MEKRKTWYSILGLDATPLSLNNLLLIQRMVSFQICTYLLTYYVLSFKGILFTKTLGKIQNEGVKRAEVAAWFKNYDEAEKLYLEADMRMLAVRMRKRLGDWFKVVQLLKTGTGGNDTEIEEAYNEVQICLKCKQLSCYKTFIQL